MRSKAAVARRAGEQHLTIETVDLQGYKFGEVLVENQNHPHIGFDLIKRGASIRGTVLY